MHCRQQIRDAVVNAITAALPTHTVVAYRMTSFTNDELPAVSVYTAFEQVGKSNMQGVIERDLTLRVEAYRRGSVVGMLDDDCVIIEDTVITALGTLPLLMEANLDAVETLVNTEGDSPKGVCGLQYLIKYRTSPFDPETFVK